MKLQSFNQYRQRIKMKPYKSFSELTGERELAAVLKELYSDVDAVELYVGLMAERSPPGAIFGMTMFELGSPFSLIGTRTAPDPGTWYYLYSTYQCTYTVFEGISLKMSQILSIPFERSEGIFGNVLCSPRFYRPSTFGGRVGWDIAHTATLKRLICANIPGGVERCPHAGFRVPDHRSPVGLVDPGTCFERNYCIVL